MQARKSGSRSLVAVLGAVAILVALTTLLLLSLRRPAEGPETGTEGPSPPGVRRERPRPPVARGGSPARSVAPPRRSQPGSAGSGGSVDEGGGASGSSGIPAPVHHVSAPAAIPSEIQRETDPARRATLLKMHRLATARVRLSQLRRRHRLLQDSLAQGRKDGSWSPEKIRQAEQDLTELAGGVGQAEQRLEAVRQEVGGDIDR